MQHKQINNQNEAQTHSIFFLIIYFFISSIHMLIYLNIKFSFLTVLILVSDLGIEIFQYRNIGIEKRLRYWMH
jgi:hypothetical protein